MAARARAFEPRLSAAVLIDGVWDRYAVPSAQLSPGIMAVYEANNYPGLGKEILLLRLAGKFRINAACCIDQGLRAFHAHSPSEPFAQSKQYQLKGVVDKTRDKSICWRWRLRCVFPRAARAN